VLDCAVCGLHAQDAVFNNPDVHNTIFELRQRPDQFSARRQRMGANSELASSRVMAAPIAASA